MTETPTIRGDVPRPFRAEFSTRLGGVSAAPFSSLNLGLLTEDRPHAVLENRKRLLAGMGVDAKRASMCRQVHGTTVTRAERLGIEAPRSHPERDGVWTDRAEEAVMVLSADCLPIALCRAGPKPAIAAVHAGWRGLLAGVVQSAAEALGSTELHASIGPGIGVCCYEVGAEVAEPFRDRFGTDVTRGRHLDLKVAARRALEELGVAEVHTVDACTSCDQTLFFSHRRDRGRTGRQGLVAFIEKSPA